MNHAMTLDANHRHVPDERQAARDIVRGDHRSSLEYAGLVYPNDRKLVPLTLGLLAIMAILSSALLVYILLRWT